MLDELLILKKIKEGDIKAFEELFRAQPADSAV